MDWLTFEGVNWIGVAVAFIVSFAFGWWYYSPAGLWKVWRRAAKVENVDMENQPMAVAFGGTIIANLLGVILLAVLMVQLPADSWQDGLVLGALIGLVYRGGAHAIHNGFAMRSPKVTMLDALHDMLALAIAGVVLGLF